MGKDKAETDEAPLKGEKLVKETCRRIRLARNHWDAHENSACRTERDRALQLYATLTPEQKKKIPQVLLVWLRYRSEKYFGADRTAPGGNKRSGSKKKSSVTKITGFKS